MASDRPLPPAQAIAVALAERGIHDRANRLRAIEAIIARPITSSKELTPAETRLVLETLQLVEHITVPDPQPEPEPPTDAEALVSVFEHVASIVGEAIEAIGSVLTDVAGTLHGILVEFADTPPTYETGMGDIECHYCDLGPDRTEHTVATGVRWWHVHKPTCAWVRANQALGRTELPGYNEVGDE